MNQFLHFALLITFSVGISCRSSDSAREEISPTTTDTSRITPFQPQYVKTTTIKPNLSVAAVTVDSVVTLDDVQYKAFLYINDVMPQSGRTSLAEAGQRVVVLPQYMKDSDGSVDFGNQRNKKLFDVRRVKPGDVLNVKISLQSSGGWVLLDIDNQ